MSKIIFIFELYFLVFVVSSEYFTSSTTERYPMRYMRVHWLTNLGKIFGSSYDTVKFQATAATPNEPIVCGTGGQAVLQGEQRPVGIQFTNGEIYKFDNLMIPVKMDDFLVVTIGVNGQKPDNNGGYFTMDITNLTQFGYYAGIIPMERYIAGKNVSIQFLGISFQLSEEGYTEESAYHVLLELVDIPSFCSEYHYSGNECYVFEGVSKLTLIILMPLFFFLWSNMI